MSHSRRELSIWETLRSRNTIPTNIFSLTKNGTYKLLKFDEIGITVKIYTGTYLVKKDFIDFAWDNLLKDGFLFQIN